MEISTLTKKQLKSSLSVKKSKTKEVIKNVLYTPYKNTFWPESPTEDQMKIKRILEKNLPQVKPEKINIPWNEIKNVPKTDRKKFRMEYSQKLYPQKPKNCVSQGLILGVNDVTKSLEQNCLSTVLLSNDVQPKLMVQHIIDMSILRKIPLLIVVNLRKLTKTHCGISSVALGIERNLIETSSLLEIVSCIQQIFKSISPPREHINFNRSVMVMTEPMQIEDNKILMKDLYEKPSAEKQIGNSIYLPIEGKNGRVFMPEARTRTALREEVKIEASGICPSQVREQNLIKFKSLKVKRLRNDSKRTKKKIKNLKKIEEKH